MKKRLILKGMAVSPGAAQGKARIINGIEDLENVEEGEIVFLPASHPMYALAVLKASAVICEYGGKLSHICIVSLEMGLPCITQVENARQKVKNGQNIYVDSKKGEVYLCE